MIAWEHERMGVWRKSESSRPREGRARQSPTLPDPHTLILIFAINSLALCLCLSADCAAGDGKPGESSFRVNAIDGAEMAFIPAGESRMGDDQGPSDERPLHLLSLKGFWIYRTEVTCGQFAKFLEATGYRAGKKKSFYSDPQRSRLPATDINWLDAQSYCRWAGGRLPTEAEWERAARGPESFAYPYGNTYDPSKANIFSDGLKEVASYPPNGYGLFDMSGNVWEWCADWYDPGYYSHSPRENPTGPVTGSEKVLRGGSWTNLPEYGRATFRYRFFTRERSPVYGFRCVKDE